MKTNKKDLRFLNNEPFHELSTVYKNKDDNTYNHYKLPKSDSRRQCSYEQWKEYYIADYAPNLSEEVVNEPIESPGSGKLEFVKLNLLAILGFGEKSGLLADRIRTEVTKAIYTGKSPSSGLRDMVLKEIELGNPIIIRKCFGDKAEAQAANADTWWAEEGITEKKVDRSLR